MDISALEDALSPFMTFADNIRDFLTLPVEILGQIAVWGSTPEGADDAVIVTQGETLSSGLENLSSNGGDDAANGDDSSSADLSSDNE